VIGFLASWLPAHLGILAASYISLMLVGSRPPPWGSSYNRLSHHRRTRDEKGTLLRTLLRAKLPNVPAARVIGVGREQLLYAPLWGSLPCPLTLKDLPELAARASTTALCHWTKPLSR